MKIGSREFDFGRHTYIMARRWPGDMHRGFLQGVQSALLLVPQSGKPEGVSGGGQV